MLALSTLALAAKTPAVLRVAARGFVTLMPATGCTPAACWLWVTHGLPDGFATVGSESSWPGADALAALARQSVTAARARPACPAKAITTKALAMPLRTRNIRRKDISLLRG